MVHHPLVNVVEDHQKWLLTHLRSSKSMDARVNDLLRLVQKWLPHKKPGGPRNVMKLHLLIHLPLLL